MISGTTSIVTVPDSRVYPRIITVPASPNLDQDILEDTVDAPANPIEGITRDTEQTIWIQDHQAQLWIGIYLKLL